MHTHGSHWPTYINFNLGVGVTLWTVRVSMHASGCTPSRHVKGFICDLTLYRCNLQAASMAYGYFHLFPSITMVYMRSTWGVARWRGSCKTGVRAAGGLSKRPRRAVPATPCRRSVRTDTCSPTAVLSICGSHLSEPQHSLRHPHQRLDLHLGVPKLCFA
jgi:hypothetical protein